MAAEEEEPCVEGDIRNSKIYLTVIYGHTRGAVGSE
jgi:hypothetical protein